MLIMDQHRAHQRMCYMKVYLRNMTVKEADKSTIIISFKVAVFTVK